MGVEDTSMILVVSMCRSPRLHALHLNTNHSEGDVPFSIVCLAHICDPTSRKDAPGSVRKIRFSWSMNPI